MDIVPEDVLGKIYRMNMTQVAGVRMVRAGNTVLIIERWGAGDPGPRRE